MAGMRLATPVSAPASVGLGNLRGGRGDSVVPLEDGDGDDRGDDHVEEVAPEDGLEFPVGGFEVLPEDGVVVEPEQPPADASPATRR